MYFFLNRFQRLKGDKATYCQSIYEKLDDKNKARLVKKGNITANVMGTIYAVLLALAVASAVVSFVCKFWWAGVFFCAFGVLMAYLTFSGFSWRKREGYEYAKIFGEEVIYMLGQQERDKMKVNLTVETVLEKVATEQKAEPKAKTSKKSKKDEEFVEMPIDLEKIEAKEEKPIKKSGRHAKTANETPIMTKVETKVSKTSKSTEPKKVGRPAKAKVVETKKAETVEEKPMTAKTTTKSAKSTAESSATKTAKSTTKTTAKKPAKKTTKKVK